MARVPSLLFPLVLLGSRCLGAEAAAITLETDHLRYVIGADGRNVSFADKRSGKEYLSREASSFISIRAGEKTVGPASCAFAGDVITATFTEPATSVVLRATRKPGYLIFEIVSAGDASIAEVAFPVIRLALPGRSSWISGVVAGDDFAVAARALNLLVSLQIHGAPGTPLLRPVAGSARGLAGARVALAAAPPDRLRPLLQGLVRAEGLPWSPLGGPFALDAEENRGSYVFATVSEGNVDEWIALARRAGLAQIHVIGWERSLGHYEPRRDLFPRGLEGLKSVVAKIHAAGLRAGMHTLTGGISRNDPFATPVPDPRLAKDARFTLAADIDPDENVVPTVERPGDLETSWQYSGGSNVIQIDRELIQYGGLSQAPPYGLTGCERGALGTARATHAKGAAVHHLFAIYGTFQPDENSTLVDEIADCIARPFNECGFDMIYQDGAEGMPGGPYGWAKMREAVFRRLTGRVLVEASEWGNLSWPYHSRIGAYDYPNWGLKRFTDVHCRDAEGYQASSLLAAQLGWWAILGPEDDHPGEFPDEIEYLCAKSLGTDMPMSFQGIDVGLAPPNARQDEYLDLIGQYERLRLARAVPEAVRARLRAPREDFRLTRSPGGAWQFVPTDYLEHKVTGSDDGSNAWTVRNRYAAQPARVRIEALHSAAPYDSPDGVLLAAFDRQEELSIAGTAPGVTASWHPATEAVRAATTSARYAARSEAPSRTGAWAALRRTFSPPVNLAKCGALGAWIHGDGKGQLLNLQLTNPTHFWPTWDEHYVDVDFTGWRYVELHLRERDADRFVDYQWPYSGTSAVFRSPLIRRQTSALTIYYNNIPRSDEVACFLSPVRALPVVKVKLSQPVLRIGDARIELPFALESGQYMELESAADCRLYDERGAFKQRAKLPGDLPRLEPGENRVGFTCAEPKGFRGRAKITFIVGGEPFAATKE